MGEYQACMGEYQACMGEEQRTIPIEPSQNEIVLDGAVRHVDARAAVLHCQKGLTVPAVDQSILASHPMREKGKGVDK